jgi:non-lysosomal glucosylceramidase
MKYTGRNCFEISLPLGGIGTGCIGLKGNGALVDWEIFNRPNKNSLQGYSHFAVKAMQGDRLVDARVLHGDIGTPYDGHRYHGIGSAGPHQGVGRNTLAGLPHFAGQTFTGEYPFAEIEFDRGSFPAEVRLLAFNPFIPLNDKDSTIPGAFFEITLTNRMSEAVDYTVCGVLTSPYSQADTHPEMMAQGGVSVMKISSEKETDDPTLGHLCLATDCEEITFQRNLFRGSWFDQMNTYWNEFCATPRFADRLYGEDYKIPVNNWMPLESSLLAAHVTLQPGEERTVRFLISWYYPVFTNYWNPANSSNAPDEVEDLEGFNKWRNYYAELFASGESVAWYAFEHWNRLKEESMMFKNALYACSMPDYALERAVSNLSTLKSPTCIRLTDGSFWAFEGCQYEIGSCEGSCDHVWNYAYALPFLFPSLERSMRELSYRYGQREDGGFAFRLHLPLCRKDNPSRHRPCADGQFGNIIKTYREWKISGDDEWLRKLWPGIKKAVAFAWDPRNEDQWDPEKTGILWGRQHHTLDLEMFGPSSWLVSMYLAALKAAAKMATHLGEKQTAAQYQEIFARGKAWADEHLYNGEYYTQKLDLGDKSYLDRYPGQSDQYWNEEVREISFQIGEGSSIDQVLGQWHANCCGLGEIFDPVQTRSALQAIYRYNFIPCMREYPNSCRIYCLNEEAGAVICTWPSHVKRPKVPLFYSDETMHGFEYQAAICMIQEGMLQEGFEIIRSIADRYDGEKRNPYDEIEAGSHYARSMASFALFPAVAGFRFDMPAKRIGFDPLLEKNHFTGFFSLDTGWGQLMKTPNWAAIKVLYGVLSLMELDLPFAVNPQNVTTDGKDPVGFTVLNGIICLEQEVTIRAGESLVIRY